MGLFEIAVDVFTGKGFLVSVFFFVRGKERGKEGRFCLVWE